MISLSFSTIADETIKLEFLAEQRRVILAEVRDLRADAVGLRQDTSAIMDSARELLRLTETAWRP